MLDENVIPPGDYCYTIDHIEYNHNPYTPPSIKISLCPYWHYLDVRTDESYCSYCQMSGIPSNDILIGDQCKCCGVKVE
jgi:hypothetical protein